MISGTWIQKSALAPSIATFVICEPNSDRSADISRPFQAPDIDWWRKTRSPHREMPRLFSPIGCQKVAKITKTDWDWRMALQSWASGLTADALGMVPFPE